MSFHTIPEILDDIRAGRMVVMLDDENRENEGDVIMAATHVKPEDINFMVREARGLVCLSLTSQRCHQLGLRPMVDDNTSPYHTNFTVSIEAAEGVTTGISAYDRARTVQAAVRADAVATDLIQPGHIFPLTAQPGGVLTRAGHTEASSDLAGLAGLEPAAVLVEVLHENGTMARRPDLEAFAHKHGLKIGTIADLIRYRLETEKTVVREYEEEVETEVGTFHLVAWRDLLTHHLHFSLSQGDIGNGEPVLTRVHIQNTLLDVLHVKRDDLGITVMAALRAIEQQGRGVLLVLSSDRLEQDNALLTQLQGKKPAPTNRDDPEQWRQLGLGAQILAGLDVKRLEVMGRPRKWVGLDGFGLEVVSSTAPTKQSLAC